MMDKINEFYYYVTGKPYFVCYVLTAGNRRIKRFIQLAASKEKASSEFLINHQLKAAWPKPDIDSIIIDGLKMLCFLDLNNAIPLKITTEKETKTGEYINYYISRNRIEVNKEKLKDNNGNARKLVQIPLPPTLVYEKIHNHFIKQILSVPHEKNDIMMYLIIGALIIFGIIAYFWFNSGVKPL